MKPNNINAATERKAEKRLQRAFGRCKKAHAPVIYIPEQKM
ncbi:MAG: hypothetical protein ACI4J5_04615 [Oscillospiraceae bacterium]